METTTMKLDMNRPTLPEWTRHSWVSLTERAWWQPIVSDATRVYSIIEKESVAAGLRTAAWIVLSPQDMIHTVQWASRNHLACLPITTIGKTGDSYSSVAKPTTNTTEFDYRCLILPLAEVGRFDISDDNKLGELLGYPDCCRRAFKETWGNGQVDSTYDQLANTDWTTYHPSIHTMLRFLSVRMLPFMPCTYHCDAASDYAARWFTLGRSLGFVDEMSATKEILHWPVTCSRLFGISEIVTPAVKISTRTDWTPTKETYTVEGQYNQPTEFLWTDNGFVNPAIMRDAHKSIINTLIDEVPEHARVMDLGCGNGLLLRRFKMHKTVKTAGVDSNAMAIGRIPFGTGKWMTGKIEDSFWYDWNPTHSLISGQRLKDMSPAQIATLQQHAGQLFVYLYPENHVSDPESLESLAARLLPGPFRMLQKTPHLSIGISTAAS